MKKILLFTAFLCLILSCKSEYAERMEEALKLKKDYLKVQTAMEDLQKPELTHKLQMLQKEIKFHAEVSGNEKLFLDQVWRN